LPLWTDDGVDPYRGVDVKGKVVVVHAANARPKGVQVRQLGRVTLGGTSPIVEAVLSDSAHSLLTGVNNEYLKLSLNRKYDTPDSEFFYPRTDAGPFLERNVLTIGSTTGLHNRYHLPADEARFLDVAKMTAIARTVFAVVHALGEADQRPRIVKPIPPTLLPVR
jgi:hypothetical protein